MHRRFLTIGFLALSVGLFLTGCQKSADQAANSTGADSSASGAAGSGGSASASKPAPQPIVVPADTPITVVLDQTLSSKTSTAGEVFSATVHTPVEIDGRVAIPKGASASGIVKDAKSAGKFKGAATLSVSLTSVTINGKEHAVHTTSFVQQTTGKGKRTAAIIGGGGAAGALIGGLAGGGKGAAIGAAVGAGGGTAGAAMTGNNRDITWPAETSVTFKLTDSLEVKR